MRGVISVTAISWHIFICFFLAGTSWVGNLWALICRAVENAQRVTAGSPGRGGQQREDLAVSSTKHGCCGKGPCCCGSARCHGNKDGSLIEMLWTWTHTLCCPFGLTSCCPSPSVVVTVLCQVCGRGAGVEGPCGAEDAEGSKEKRLKLFPGSWEWKTPLLGWWGQREPEGQAPRVSLPLQLWWEALWDIEVPWHCRKGVSLEKVIATWQHVWTFR